MEDRWLSVDEIGEYLGVSRDTVYSWLANGSLPGHRAGHLWRFKRDEVDEWVRSRATAPKPDSGLCLRSDQGGER